MLSNASELKKLAVQGYRTPPCRREEDYIKFNSESDAAIFCRVLELPKIRKVDLDRIKFKSPDTAEVLLKTIATWRLTV